MKPYPLVSELRESALRVAVPRTAPGGRPRIGIMPAQNQRVKP